MAVKLTQENIELLQQISWELLTTDTISLQYIYVHIPGSKLLMTLYHVIGKSIEIFRYKTVSKLFIIL